MRRSVTSTYIGKQYPPVTLYKDDFVEIADSLTQSNGSINIKTKQFEYDSMDELLSHNEDTLEGLSLSRENPYISIDFDRHSGVSVYGRNDDLVTKGIISDIGVILERNRRRSYLFVAKATRIAATLGAMAGGSLVVFGHWREASILWLLVLVDSAFVMVKHKSILHREPRSQMPSFWRRNSDQIIVAIIGAIVGAIAAVIITSTFNNAKP